MELRVINPMVNLHVSLHIFLHVRGLADARPNRGKAVPQPFRPVDAKKVAAGPQAGASPSAADRKAASPRAILSALPAEPRSATAPSTHSTSRAPSPGRVISPGPISARLSRNSGAGES